MREPRVLALDLATATGWAHWAPGMPTPRYGVWDLEKPIPEIERPGLQLRRLLREIIPTYKINTIVLEAPIMRDDYDKRMDKMMVLRFLFGLAWEAGVTGLEFGCEVRETKHQVMMKHWVGREHVASAEGKRASLGRAAEMGWPTKSDDAADALGLLNHFACVQHYNVPWNARPMPSSWLKSRAIAHNPLQPTGT